MDFKIKIADLVISLHGQYPYLKEYCRNYLIDEDRETERAKSSKTECDKIDWNRTDWNRADQNRTDMELAITNSDIQMEENETCQELPYLETLAALRKIAEELPSVNRFLMHGTVVAWKNQGFLFTAPSGTGKSTHAALWKKYLGDDVRIINGDKPILQVKDDKVLAYGTPWAGKERWEENSSVELKGVCFLQRGEKNQIQKITPEIALPLFMRQIYFPKNVENAGKILELLDCMLQNVPMYLLQCDMSEEAVLCSWNGMRSEPCD